MSKFFSQLADEMKSELAGIALLAIGTVTLLGFFTRATGAIGVYLVRACRILLGEAGLIIPVGIAWLGLQLLIGKRRQLLTLRHGGVLLLLLTGAAILHIVQIPAGEEFVRNGWRGLGGGIIGALISSALAQLLGNGGRLILLISLLLAGLMLTANRSLLELFRLLMQRSKVVLAALSARARDFFYTSQAVEAPPPATPNAEQPLATFTKRKKGLSPSDSQRRPAKVVAGDKLLLPVSKRQLGLDDELDYLLPPMSLLGQADYRRSSRGDKDAVDKARLLEDTLKSFGVGVKVIDVSRGPAVTRFELQPAPGVKVASIVSLSNDLALKLACSDLRIEAPIPGKSALGIEVPNLEISLVHLREVLETPEYRQDASPVAVALGKDISGRPIVADLERMPHLLIAGATGSGKSVCINAIIASLLFRAHPEQVKLLLIDPKMVELSQYQGIPHLLAPVVTNPKKAAGALRWVLHEMERRYELFVAAGVRDIRRYHSMSQAVKEEKSPLPPLPYIVVIIDELADLMVVAPGDVEDCIFRLAQMARAAGIHLVVATQRPSVDVITGTIKANIPSRIAFAVSSAVDSRTILDVSGAERLVGRGDMLYFPVGASKPVRVQGAFIAEQEVEALVHFVTEQGQPEYSQEALDAVAVEEAAATREDNDELFPQAVRMVVEAGQASVSLLQRKLPIGYTRAGRLIDVMEERGFIGPHEGSKPREVRLTLTEYDRLYGKKPSKPSGDEDSSHP